MYKMLNQPLVTVISVNYRQNEVTLQMLDSLQKCDYKNIEVIVVDNGSNEGLQELLKIHFPKVKCLVSSQNLGFAGGNNLGLKEARGKYVLFLNNDTEVAPNFMTPLVEVLENDPSIGLVSPKIIFYHTENLVQYAGLGNIHSFTGRGRKRAFYPKDGGQFDYVAPTELGHGAAMMVPMEAIKKVGMMSEIFFLYYEEHDWCMAIKKAGYKVFFVGKSVVYHKESVSVGKESVLKTYYMVRNRLLYMRRNSNILSFLVFLLFFAIFIIPKNTFLFMRKDKIHHLKAFWRGVVWHFFHGQIHGYPKLKNDAPDK
ncbi:MAG TPA: dTDP-Rha--alpha-D-GlcNAc-pyrophosphate polyprenol alpha-3-L-rhamnosyltransferase [Cytophagales bacterium]|nr:dTDP-Rha--alpha-D-GlcNAc-pyrophosphate polyprenol alpha-3-L-rhamnosyltransferase [Cytophagales bacterium]